jgi:hypothetical protein
MAVLLTCKIGAKLVRQEGGLVFAITVPICSASIQPALHFVP